MEALRRDQNALRERMAAVSIMTIRTAGAIEPYKPMTRSNARIVAEYLREAGWRERAIGAATKPGPDLESSGGTAAKS